MDHESDDVWSGVLTFIFGSIISEMMASLILLVHLATDSLLEHAGAPGESAIAPDLKGSKRVGAVAVYCTIMCCQILGIFISHHIIQHRNELAAKLQSLKSAALSVAGAALPPPLEDQHSWHFFLRQKTQKCMFWKRRQFENL